MTKLVHCVGLITLALSIWCAAAPANAATLVTDPALVASAAERSNHHPGASDFDPAESVRAIYARFADASRASGHGIRFEIADVTTYRPEQFDELLWFDLFTAPGGWSIETTPYERAEWLPSRESISFASTWRQVDGEPWRRSSFSKTASEMRAIAALAQLAKESPERFSGLDALSRIAVDVTFDHRSRQYDALVLWKRLAGNTVLFTLIDHVVPGIDRAFHEPRTAVPTEQILEFADPSMAYRAQEDAGRLPTKACLNLQYDQYDPTLWASDSTGHSSGQHQSSLRAARLCQLSNCRSTCTPYQAGQSCADLGSISNPLYWHKKSTSIRVSSINGIGTNSSECGYAFGCAVRSCLLGWCSGASFGAQGYGAKLTISATSSVVSDMSLSKGGFCQAGETIDPPNDDDGGPGCNGLIGEIATVSLRDGTIGSELPARDFMLTRLEPSTVEHGGHTISYLMGEWALLRSTYADGAAGNVTAVGGSNPEFGRLKGAELESVLAGPRATKMAADDLLLVVGMPPHEANSRRIPLPDLEVAAIPVRPGTPVRKIFVRADFAEDTTLQALEILHDTSGGVPHELALQIEKALSLTPVHDEQHRVIAFALLSVGETLNLESSLLYLPKCCCGTEFCI